VAEHQPALHLPAIQPFDGLRDLVDVAFDRGAVVLLVLGAEVGDLPPEPLLE